MSCMLDSMRKGALSVPSVDGWMEWGRRIGLQTYLQGLLSLELSIANGQIIGDGFQALVQDKLSQRLSETWRPAVRKASTSWQRTLRP